MAAAPSAARPDRTEESEAQKEEKKLFQLLQTEQCGQAPCEGAVPPTPAARRPARAGERLNADSASRHRLLTFICSLVISLVISGLRRVAARGQWRAGWLAQPQREKGVSEAGV